MDDQIVSPVRLPRLLTLLLPATAAMYALYQGIQQVLLPAQVDRLDPASKVTTLAVVTTLAAIAAMIGLPLGGSVSDRSRSRFGRRTPWLVISSVVCGGLLLGMACSTGLVVLATSYSLLWFASNFYQGALSAILPDRVPARLRGVASAVIGMGTSLGALLGVNLASRLSPLWAYASIALILIVATVALAVGAREAPARGPGLRPSDEAGGGALRAFRSRDFSLAFSGRAALFLAYFTVTGYLFYTLQDYIGTRELPAANVASAVSTLATISVIASIIAALTGWLADRLGRRTLCAAISSAGLGLSMLVPLVSPTWPGMLVFAALSGAFIGAYLAVDLAVMSLVLPERLHAGRDLGILAVATGFPQVMSAPVAAVLITHFGYPALFGFGAVCALVAGGVVLAIRTVP